MNANGSLTRKQLAAAFLEGFLRAAADEGRTRCDIVCDWIEHIGDRILTEEDGGREERNILEALAELVRAGKARVLCRAPAERQQGNAQDTEHFCWSWSRGAGRSP